MFARPENPACFCEYVYAERSIHFKTTPRESQSVRNAIVMRIHRLVVYSSHKGPVMRKPISWSIYAWLDLPRGHVLGFEYGAAPTCPRAVPLQTFQAVIN